MEKAFSAWIGNMGAYAEGNLKGGWVNFPAAPEELRHTLDQIGGEEKLVLDYRIPEKYDFLHDVLGEYASPQDLNLVGAALQGLDGGRLEAVTAFMEYGGTLAIPEFLNAVAQADEIPYTAYEFKGIENVRDMTPQEKCGYTVAENTMSDLMEKLEEYHMEDYLDYEAIGRDMEQSGNVLGENGYLDCKASGPDLSLYTMEELRERYELPGGLAPDITSEIRPEEPKETGHIEEAKGPRL